MLRSGFLRQPVSVGTRAVVVSLVIALFPLHGLATSPMPDAGPTLYILPTEIHPGGQVRVAGLGFTPATWYKVWLALGEVPVSPADAVSVRADASGQIRTRLSLPEAVTPGGNYNIMAGLVVGTHDAFTPAGILPAISLSLNPTSAPPGTVVQVTVANLTPGSLQLDYDGRPVLGPLPLSGTSYSDSFVVPNDRPDPLGSATTVQAINRVSGLAVGTAGAAFLSQAVPAPPSYKFTKVKLPTEPVMPGESFTISGLISPAPKGPLSDYDVVVLWRGPGTGTAGAAVPGAGAALHQVFPISNGPAIIEGNGQFQIEVHSPSLVSGDPFGSGQGNEIGLVLHTPDGPASSGLYNYEGPPRLAYKVVVKDAITAQPIEGVKVQVTFDYSNVENLPASLAASGPDPAADINSPQNQVGDGASDAGETAQQMACDGAQTDAVGELEAILNPEQPIVNWQNNASLLAATHGVGGLASQGQNLASRTQEAAVEPWQPPVLSGWYRYRILVDGLDQCYGVSDANHIAQPVVFEKVVWFNETSGHLRDLYSNPLPVPFEVLLQKIPTTHCGLSILPVLDHGRLSPDPVILTLAGEWPKYTGLVSFAGISGVDRSGLRDLKVSFFVEKDQADQFKDPKLWFDGAAMGAFDCVNVLRSGAELCAQADHPDISFVRCEAAIPVSAFKNKAARLYVLRIEGRNPGGQTLKRYLGVEFGSPPGWFQNPDCHERRVEVVYDDDLQHATKYLLQCSLPQRKQTLDATIDDVGPQSNSAGGSSIRTEALSFSGESSTALEAMVLSEALNSTGKDRQVAAQAAGGPASGPITAPLPTETHSIVDTGWMPVFRSIWGVWPIASATLGADMWFSSKVQSGGALVIYPNSADTHLCVYPFANIYVHSYFDLSAIFGLAKAKASAYPSIGMGLPVHIKNGQTTGNQAGTDSETYCGFQSDACFEWLLDVGYYTRLGRCPLCSKKSGIKRIFQGSEPDPCSLPNLDSARIASATSVEPVHASPTVATDGSGHTQAIYVDDSTGHLVHTSYDGLGWTDANTLTLNTSADSPQIAYFAANKAVAVWAESRLSTPAQWNSTTISDAVETMHLVYAVYDGVWSTPADLTTPSGGEGSVALGACPDGGSGCPVGGQVTAVWLRKESGGLAERQFRLYYTYFQGASGTWGAVDPLNPGSTNTETQPQVVYDNGQALVAWVRDDDDLSDSSDRRVVTKLLGVHNSAAGPAVLPNLPDNIVDITMAVDSSGEPHLAFTRIEAGGGLVGSRHNLHSAARSGADWTHHRLTDSHGRVIRAEAPVLTLDKNDRGTITFRGLGFGPLVDGSYMIGPGETSGMITGAGELAQVEVAFDGEAVNPVFLTEDGAVYWQAASAYDPVSNSTFALAVRGSPVSSSVVQDLQEGGYLHVSSSARGIQTVAEGSPVVFASVPRLPDFAAVQLTPSTRNPEPGDTATVHVQVRNDGINFDESAVEIVATWDGGPGVGASAGQSDLLLWSAGEPQTVTLTLADPPGGYERVHELVVTVNPDQSIPEPDATNNSLNTTMGGLPTPADVVTAVRSGRSTVFLQWTELEHSEVAGYRVYRSVGNGSSVMAGTGAESAAGSTFVPGFVDYTAESNHAYQYRVVSFSEAGFESEPSDPVEVKLQRWRVRLPLVKRQAR